MKPVVDNENGRRADLAKIHIAVKQLGWSKDEYHDILRAVCHVESSAALDFAGRKRLLAHLEKCGWKPGKGRQAAARPVRQPLTPPQRKMWSLWQQLADAGLVRERKMPALLKFVTRTTGVDRLEWLSGVQEDLVIETLKKWLSRRAEPV